MKHDFSKPTHVTSTAENMQKKRLPVYILVVVGLFLVALLVYMVAYRTPEVRASDDTKPLAEFTGIKSKMIQAQGWQESLGSSIGGKHMV